VNGKHLSDAQKYAATLKIDTEHTVDACQTGAPRPKVLTEPDKVPGQLLPSELVSNTIQDGGGHQIENHIFGHNSAIIARICTEFET